MTTQQTRKYTLSIHRVLICMLVVIGVWCGNDIVERVLFTLSTVIWVYGPSIVHFELELINRWTK